MPCRKPRPARSSASSCGRGLRWVRRERSIVVSRARRYWCVPSPLVGEGRVGASRKHRSSWYPPLQLSPTRGERARPCDAASPVRISRTVRMTPLSPTGFLTIGDADLEYRMIGPQPTQAPTIVMLHEGLGSAALWGDFPQSCRPQPAPACSSIPAQVTARRRRSNCRARSTTCMSRRSRFCRNCWR